MAQKHILVVSQCFFPEQFRINDICLEWVKRGNKVTVLTGIPNYPQGKFYTGYHFFKKRRENWNGIEIIRIPILPRGHNHIMLGLNYLSFVVSGFFWKLFTKLRADCVFIFEVSPMTQALPGVWYAKKRKIPCSIYVQDLWPETVEIITGISNPHLLAPIGRMVDRIYAGCSTIFTTSRRYIGAIVQRGVPEEKIVYLPQYAEDFFVPLKRQAIDGIVDDGAFHIIFTGNIGNAQGLDILIETARHLQQTGCKVRFTIVGDGRYKSELVRLISAAGVEALFNFIPKQPIECIPAFLAACDAAFLCLTASPIFEMTIPAKLQSYMACGKPMLVSAGGETAEIVKEADAGMCSPPGDAQALAQNIVTFINMDKPELQKFGLNARRYYDENFDKKNLLNRLDLVMEK